MCGPSWVTTRTGPAPRCFAPNATTPTARRHGSATEGLRAPLADAAAAHLPDWSARLTPHVLRHFCASQLYFGGMDLVAIQETARTRLDRDDDGLRSRSPHACRGRLGGRAAACRRPVEGAEQLRWNLRLAAANRGIWKASELQRLLAERGLVITPGKMSGLWSGQPTS